MGLRNCLSFETAAGGIEPPLTVRRSTALANMHVHGHGQDHGHAHGHFTVNMYVRACVCACTCLRVCLPTPDILLNFLWFVSNIRRTWIHFHNVTRYETN